MQSSHDDRAVRFVTAGMLDRLSEKAARLSRGRTNHNFHELDDPYQRMLNVIEPGSYVRPHRHRQPPKSESFVVVRGEIAFFVFDDAGTVLEARCVGPQTGTPLVDLRPGVWHALAALRPGTVLFEGKNGPYDPRTDKEFAPWAPAEGEPGAGEYLRGLLTRLEGE